MPKPSNPEGVMRYVMRIVDNIEVEVKNVHIRYEDEVSGISSEPGIPSRTFAVGVTLDTVTIKTVNDNGQPEYMLDFAPINKRVRLPLLFGEYFVPQY
jgi:vacuolar protein sorting-associated protein 13A/C